MIKTFINVVSINKYYYSKVGAFTPKVRFYW